MSGKDEQTGAEPDRPVAMERRLEFTPVCVRGLPLSTYALRGRWGVGPNADIVLRQ